MKLNKPFLVAEISANHNGKLSNALKLIKEAKLYGADAVKIQTYTPDSMTLRSNKKYFKIKSGLWKGYNLWNLYNQAKTPYEWHNQLFKFAKKINIKLFSTPFDEVAVDFLEKLNCPIYKIASFEMHDLNLIKKVAKTEKPMIISTGMATLDEISRSFLVAKKNGCKDITLLYCVSNYPSDIKDFNLNNIKILKKKFKCRIGLSDHSKNNIVAKTAVALGAEIIEKHIGLKNQKKGLDIEFSLKGEEIQKFKNEITEVENLKGGMAFFRSKSENSSRMLRRSIFIAEDIKKGEKFTPLNIKKVRPGNGLSPHYYEKLINKKSPKKLIKGEPLKKNILKKIFSIKD
tara:strand:+ start:269 stop:1303 length:1035 start_codon:yes stop_codon:yes gene_type:complete